MRSETIHNQQSKVFFSHDGSEIRIPFLSECGRFLADPRTYGFTEEKLGGRMALVLELPEGGQIRLTDPTGLALPSHASNGDNLIARYNASEEKIAEFKIDQIVLSMAEHNIQAQVVTPQGEFVGDVEIEHGKVSIYEKLPDGVRPDFVWYNGTQHPIAQSEDGSWVVEDVAALVAEYEARHLAAPATDSPIIKYHVVTGEGEVCLPRSDFATAHEDKWGLLSSGHIATISDMDGVLVLETDPLLIQKEAFCELMADLRAKDKVFHLDDSPSEIINIASGEPTFSPEEADRLANQVADFREALGNDLLWETAWPFINDEPTSANESATTKTSSGPRLG